MASAAHPEATSTTPTPEETLDELLRDAPRNAEARARQEAAWDLQGKEDARRLLYEREVAARHARLLVASINAFWRAEVLAQGHAQGVGGRGHADDLHQISNRRLVLLVELAVDARDVGRVVLVCEGSRRRRGAALSRDATSRYAGRAPWWNFIVAASMDGSSAS